LTVSIVDINESDKGDNFKHYTFLLVDDEHYIRSAVKRVIISVLKNCNDNIKLEFIEASDGIECILALYIAKNKKRKIDAIISDETMPFISGSHTSKIIEEIISKGNLGSINNMYISSALNNPNMINNYSQVVKKIFSKPLNKNVIQEIMQNIQK